MSMGTTAAFFDLDKTLIAKPALVAFSPALHREGLLSRRMVARGAVAGVRFRLQSTSPRRMAQYQTMGLKIIRGWDSRQVALAVEESVSTVIPPILFPAVVGRIDFHRRMGCRTFLASTGPEEVVGPVARYLGIDEVIASRAEVDEHGRYTGHASFWAYGPAKAAAIVALAAERDIDLSASAAYSDSATDLPMLEAVGRPTAVNPERRLARVADDRGWPVLRARL
jgi:HAD superfamily hydrolase (TIGR01490 family)